MHDRFIAGSDLHELYQGGNNNTTPYNIANVDMHSA